MARRTPPRPDPVATDDQASAVRGRDWETGERPRREPSARSRARPPVGSLDDRLEKKMQLADERMKGLPPNDARVRLLYVAIMRRDEALLDGLLSELNKTPPSR